MHEGDEQMRGWVGNERGQGAVEYVLLISLIVIVVVVFFTWVFQNLPSSEALSKALNPTAPAVPPPEDSLDKKDDQDPDKKDGEDPNDFTWELLQEFLDNNPLVKVIFLLGAMAVIICIIVYIAIKLAASRSDPPTPRRRKR
jgi:Flp pilus assembly pilin Flp